MFLVRLKSSVIFLGVTISTMLSFHQFVRLNLHEMPTGADLWGPQRITTSVDPETNVLRVPSSSVEQAASPAWLNGDASEPSGWSFEWPSIEIPNYVFFILLALQAGCQPVVTKVFMPSDGIVRSTAVLGQELAKFITSFLLMLVGGELKDAFVGWTPTGAIMAAGVPAGIYVVQNYCNIAASQVLPPVTWATLNQTKTLSTALCCFLLMGQKQSPIQMLALLLLIGATLVVQKIIPLDGFRRSKKEDPPKDSSSSSLKSPLLEESEHDDDDDDEEKFLEVEADDDPSKKKKKAPSPADESARLLAMGVVPALIASFLSGLAGTLTQQTLQHFNRSTNVFNMELSVFSSIFLLLTFAAGSPDYKKIKEGGFAQGWKWKTWIPIITNALGGILVGLVTKHQGAVVKGFAMIFGMVVSGALQQILFGKDGGGVTREQFLGGSLGAFSLYLHVSHPPQA